MQTYIELRYALVNAWGIDMLIFIVYPPRIDQCVPQLAQAYFHHAKISWKILIIVLFRFYDICLIFEK